MCKYFLQGRCVKDDCQFAHSEAELRGAPRVSDLAPEEKRYPVQPARDERYYPGNDRRRSSPPRRSPPRRSPERDGGGRWRPPPRG